MVDGESMNRLTHSQSYIADTLCNKNCDCYETKEHVWESARKRAESESPFGTHGITLLESSNAMSVDSTSIIRESSSMKFNIVHQSQLASYCPVYKR